VIEWTDGKPLTPVQRTGLLLLNVPSERRGLLLQSVRSGNERLLEPYAQLVARACRRAIDACQTEEEHWKVWSCSEEMADLLERRQAVFEATQNQIRLVATLSKFFFLAGDGALPPVERWSLMSGIKEVLLAARKRLCICIPFMSETGTEDLTLDLAPNSRRGLEVEIIALLTSELLAKNAPGVAKLVAQFEAAGARVTVRSLTDEEAALIGALVPMHAKFAIADGVFAYLGSGNFSVAALYRVLEAGVLIKGPLVRELQELFDWIAGRLQVWEQAAGIWEGAARYQ